MTIVVALSSATDRQIYIDQRLVGLRRQYGELDKIRFLAPAEYLDHYRAAMSGLNIAPLVAGALAGATEFVDCEGSHLEQAQREAPEARCYFLSNQGRFHPRGRAVLDERDYPYFDTHPFNRYSPRDTELGIGCFYYFPYGMLVRSLGQGPANEFGHRITVDLESLVNRPPHHVVIAVFGGSATFSIACDHDQMFTQVMERELARRARESGSDLTFTTLNFGTPGAVVLNEIITFLLFASRLRPNIVISHDGANDMGYSRGSSSFLIERFDIVYQQQLEVWSRVLHEPGYDGPRIADSPRDRDPNPALPGPVIRAYIRRNRQFSTVARAFGAKFIWGLQPHFRSKGALSEQEVDWIVTSPRVADADDWEWARQLYDLFHRNMPPLGDDLFVDFDRLFGRCGSDRTLMADVVHLDPQGDELVGTHYAEVIWSNRARLIGDAVAGTPAQPRNILSKLRRLYRALISQGSRHAPGAAHPRALR
jgi:hypothetical protein